VIYGIEITRLKTYSTELSKKVSVSADRVVKLIGDELRSEPVKAGD
jgi:hypothetical protein